MLRRALFGAAMLAVAACQQPALASEEPMLAPAPERAAKESAGKKIAIFAGGCFWGVEGVFSHVKGVTSAVSGYHGGDGSNATYSKVSAGGTRHAEVVKVTYDPAQIRYDQLLRVFFSVIVDPTQLNRQGPDSGRQYRSAVVPLSEEQRRVASAYLAQIKASGLWSKPIVTRLERYRKFHPAEASHQDFMAAHPRHPYILRWDAPKVKALRAYYPGLYRASFKTG